MKIILSKKGFNSQDRGIPSPIMPDGTLLSLPIPENGSGVLYESLSYGKYSYKEILQNLGYLQSIWECHLDPDIYKIGLTPTNWKAIFGQCDSAAGHLIKQEIGKGDIFLFFGTFKETEVSIDGRLQFKKNTSEKHIIYGYLQIGQVKDSDFNEYHWHPHSNTIKYKKNNRMYIAAENFLNTVHPGHGAFKYNKELVLTKEGETKSKWIIPNIFRDKNMTYHPNPHRGEYFQSTSRGQEFVVKYVDKKEITDAQKWILSMIEL